MVFVKEFFVSFVDPFGFVLLRRVSGRLTLSICILVCLLVASCEKHKYNKEQLVQKTKKMMIHDGGKLILKFDFKPINLGGLMGYYA